MSADFEARLEREKLDAMKELAYGASHEINNPLANISARAQTLLRDEPHPERRRALEAIRQQAVRAHEMISDLMLFARPPALVLERVNLGQLLTSIYGSWTEPCEARNIRLLLQLPEQEQFLTADADQLTVAVTAVIRNALEASDSGDTITMILRELAQPAHSLASPASASLTSASLTSGPPASASPALASPALAIEVTDTGSGMTAEVRRHLFDPFFSGREAGRGLGFGMSKCWRIVTDHQGTVVVQSDADEGTTISLQLPLG